MNKYLASLKVPFLLTVILFFATALLGYLFGGSFSHYWQNLGSFFGSLPQNPLALLGLIFANNSVKSLLSILLGVFFGVVPILFVSFNGLIIGLGAFVEGQKIGIVKYVLCLLPHGIIEIPMILLSAAVGIRVGYETWKKVSSGNSEIKKELKKGLNLFARLILPLLFVAAVIETLLIVFAS